MKLRKKILVAILICAIGVLIYTRIMMHSAYLSASQSPNQVKIQIPGQTIHRRLPGESTNSTLPKNLPGNSKNSQFPENLPKKNTNSQLPVNLLGKSTNSQLPVKLPKIQTYMSGSVPNDIKPSAKKKLIVMFNRPEWLFPADPKYLKVFDTCPYSCMMTDDRNQLPLADAVWVDIGRLNDRQPPPNRPPRQMWVAYNIESPVHFLGFVRSSSWKSVFNRTFSYRTDSDFFRPYGEFELRAKPAWKNYTQIMLNKTKSIAWFVSNCYTLSRREQYVNELKKYIDVDVYGTCGTLHCPGLTEEKCFRPLNDTYFFYLAFENSYCQDYMTEKLFKTYKNLNVITIVRGASNYSSYLPPNTYLDTANFSSPKHLAQYLHGLMKDVHTYTNMLRTKDHFYTSYISWVFPNLKPFCRLCRMLQMSPPPQKVYPDIVEWSSRDKCWDAPNV